MRTKDKELEVQLPVGLDELSFDKAEVLDVLHRNRDEHRTIFIEALSGYETRMQEELQRRLEDVRNHRPVEQYIRLEVPKDHTTEYDTVISMLERSRDNIITLDMDEYSNFIMDNWSWQGDFLNNASAYGSMTAGTKFKAK